MDTFLSSMSDRQEDGQRTADPALPTSYAGQDP